MAAAPSSLKQGKKKAVLGATLAEQAQQAEGKREQT